MATASVTSKGQVTIPKRIRERLRIRKGDKVDFLVEEDGSVRLHPIARRVSEVYGAFASRASRPLSDGEIKRRLRGAFKEGKV